MIIFGKITNFARNFWKKSFFPGDFEGANSLKNSKNDSRGIIFVIISCQRVINLVTVPIAIFGALGWEATDLGNCPKRANHRKRFVEDAPGTF